MTIINDSTKMKIRTFFQSTGILFPSGKRSDTDRRMKTIEPEFWEMPERRNSTERRQKNPEDSDLAGML